MTSSTHNSDGDLAGDPTADQGGRTGVISLEIAQRIALESLQADHQALERHPPSSTIWLEHASAGSTTPSKPLNGS